MAVIGKTATLPDFGSFQITLDQDTGLLDYSLTTRARTPDGPNFYNETGTSATAADMAATFASIISHHATAMRTAGYSFPGDTLA